MSKILFFLCLDLYFFAFILVLVCLFACCFVCFAELKLIRYSTTLTALESDNSEKLVGSLLAKHNYVFSCKIFNIFSRHPKIWSKIQRMNRCTCKTNDDVVLLRIALKTGCVYCGLNLNIIYLKVWKKSTYTVTSTKTWKQLSRSRGLPSSINQTD